MHKYVIHKAENSCRDFGSRYAIFLPAHHTTLTVTQSHAALQKKQKTVTAYFVSK